MTVDLAKLSLTCLGNSHGACSGGRVRHDKPRGERTGWLCRCPCHTPGAEWNPVRTRAYALTDKARRYLARLWLGLET